MHRPDDVSTVAKAFATLVVVLFGGFVLTSSLAGSRLLAVPGSEVADLLTIYSWATTIISAFWLLRERPRLALVMLLLLAAALMHAHLHLGTTALPGNTEGHLASAEVYLGHAAVILFGGLAAGLGFSTASPRARQLLLAMVAAAFAANTLATYLQGRGQGALLAALSDAYHGTTSVRLAASGFLEQPLALNTYGAALVTGLAYLMLFGTWTWQQRLLWLLLSMATGWAYLATGGRTYLVIIALSLAVCLPLALIHIKHPAGRARAKWVVPAAAAASVLCVLCLPLSPLIKLGQDLSRILSGLSASDEGRTVFVRFCHDVLQVGAPLTASMLTTAAAFADHPWLGVGLGSSSLDPADPFYLLLAAALGAAGLTLSLLMITKGFSACRQLVTIPTGLHGLALSRQAWLAFATGAYLSLLVSFLLGTHLNFLSISGLSALVVFGLAMQPGMLLASTTWTRTLLLLSLALLLCGCAYMLWLAATALS